MECGDLTVNSPSGIKRWSHRSRFVRALELGDLAPGQVIADYGAGDGYLLQQAIEQGAGQGGGAELWAFEPMLADQARKRLGDRGAHRRGGVAIAG